MAIQQEVLESQEMMGFLIRVSMGEKLTRAQRNFVIAQLKDLSKMLPALGIFALPGGVILLPLFIKLIKIDLMPSSFKTDFKDSVVKPQLVKLEPYLSVKPWAGHRLRKYRRYPVHMVGETWEVSFLPEGASKLENRPCNELVEEDSDYFVGKDDSLSYLVKFIDTSQELSIQVHPNDEIAAKLENGNGKDECWFILEAGPESVVYAGLKPGLTKEDLENELKGGANLSQLLNSYPVTAGQFVNVPAGTIHAIGKDILLLEVQKSSGITYRVWDWNRRGKDGKPRELHLEKAFQAIKFNSTFNQKSRPLTINAQKEWDFEHPDYQLKMVQMEKEEDFTLVNSPMPRSGTLVCLDGKIKIGRGEEILELNTYDVIFLPAGGEADIWVNALENSRILFVC